jgi:valyl-tRNA synthetase
MRISEQRLEAGRNFANKLWNAARYVISRLDARQVARPALEQREALALEDRWILSRLQRLVASVEQLLEAYQFGEAGRQIHDFLWGEYCDWYVEMSKVRLARGDNSVLPVLVHVLETGLRILHPYMPFVTEELWQTLSEHLADREAGALIVCQYPQPDADWYDEEAERQAVAVMDYTRAIRNIRSEKSVDASRLVEAYVLPQAGVYDAARGSADLIAALARARPLHVVSPQAEVPTEAALTSVLSHGQVVVPLAGLFDLEAERARLTRQVEQAEGQVSRLEAKLAEERFRAKAPPHIVAQEEERLTAARSRLEGLRRRLTELGQE